MPQNRADIRSDKDNLSGKSDESVSSKQTTVTSDSAQSNVSLFLFCLLLESFNCINVCINLYFSAFKNEMCDFLL